MAKTSRAPASRPATGRSRSGRAGLGGRRRGPPVRPQPDDQGGQGEGARIDDERGPDAQEADQRAADHEAEDLGQLVRGQRHRGAEHVPVPRQDVGVDRGPGGGERRAHQGHGEQQRDQRGDRQAGQHHDEDQPAADQVAGDHDLAARQPIRQAAQEHAADEGGHDAGRERDRREQRRAGPVVDQEGQRDPGQLVAAHRQDLGQPQGAELGHGEHVAERSPGKRAVARESGLCISRDCFLRVSPLLC